MIRSARTRLTHTSYSHSSIAPIRLVSPCPAQSQPVRSPTPLILTSQRRLSTPLQSLITRCMHTTHAPLTHHSLTHHSPLTTRVHSQGQNESIAHSLATAEALYSVLTLVSLYSRDASTPSFNFHHPDSYNTDRLSPLTTHH